MNDKIPTCSNIEENCSGKNDELEELRLAEGIHVWGAEQAKLEQQALVELQILTEASKKQDEVEDGEIQETTYKNKPREDCLDIGGYIKRQEEFKKRQEYTKSIKVPDKSVVIANKICKNKAAKKKLRDKIKGDKSIIPLEHNVIENKNDEFLVNNLVVINNNEENGSGSEYVPSDGEFDSDYDPGFKTNSLDTNCDKIPIKKKRKSIKNDQIEKIKDDGSMQCYQARLNLYYKTLEEENELKAINPNELEDIDELEYQILKGGLKVPIKYWNNLYSYQQDGLKWLWEIHQKPTGGLLGDEMGLGKTVQIITFLHSLEYSKIISGRFTGTGPSIIVCPATVIHQWVQHFHEWAPEFRVAILHQSGSFQGNKVNLIKEIHKCSGMLITTYLGILKYKGNLLDHNWHYIILDEGHKIRNPTAKVSMAVKQIRTPHRIMLTGSPMQNNLTELWSLFDFTNPGMLGNLNTFQEHFANPILHGGFANSTPMQEATALSVATTLKKVITPYLLRRTKNEVQSHILLPNKSEQVLFCSLTEEQKDLYKGFLMSENVNMILGRGTKNWGSDNQMRANVLVAITTLRKICNHPDLYLYETDEDIQDNENTPAEDKFGYYKRSGKMVVVSALLKIWKKQGHRVLLFSQGRAMLAIFQDFLEQNNYKYLKMDGSTSISSRQPLIDKFNQDATYNVFLLTTRVGGLGINLTGANRVIIYDPDWNPATDTQARERAWRIGQEKQVTVYRLLSAGTIEEKMYQRQVWKQLLSNKILIDPKTHRVFKASDLTDLFSLQESPDTNPETANIFHDSRVKLQENLKRKHKKGKKSNRDTEPVSDEPESFFSEDKIQAMKNLAQQISKNISNKNPGNSSKPSKSGYQLELEEERKKKLQEKEKLKNLSAFEIMLHNKNKTKEKEEELVNKLDDSDTSVSFSKALEYSEKTAKLYHDLNTGKIKETNILKSKSSDTSEKRKCSDEDDKGEHTRKKRKSKSKHRDKTVVDISGTVDGEDVEGLVKSEIKEMKTEKLNVDKSEAQDNYVLEKLFSKKGVSGALQHDSVVQGTVKRQTLKMHTEAKLRADKSLEAIRKSRLNNWSW